MEIALDCRPLNFGVVYYFTSAIRYPYFSVFPPPKTLKKKYVTITYSAHLYPLYIVSFHDRMK